MTALVRLRGENKRALVERADELGLSAEEYVALALSVCEQLPRDVMLAVAAGVPVSFFAACMVGGDDLEM